MSRPIGVTDVREWRSLTSRAKSKLGSIDANLSVEFSATTIPDIIQLTEFIEQLNATAKRYRDIAREDVDKMNTACERIEERDRQMRDAWRTMR